MDLKKLKVAGAVGSIAREMARLEEDRASWRNALIHTDSIAKQMKELTQVGSAYAQMIKDIQALPTPAMTVAQQYKDLLGESSLAMQTVRQWQEAQKTERESIRKMLDPLADIRKSLLLDDSTQRFIKEFAEGNSIRDQFKEIMGQASGIGAFANMWAQQIDDSRAQTKRLFENLGVGSSIQSYLQDFEHINKQWKVPSEVLGIVGSFKELHEQIGKVALPTIDWGSAAALAKLLGQEGINKQLAYLGIEPDGTLHVHTVSPEKGLLSRSQADALAILSLLLTILIFFYQEYSSSLQQAKSEAFQKQITASLQVQAQQIQSLTILMEKALVHAAQEPQERFVVRDRTATVRSKPEHGASVEGKLLPNEVVRAINRKGRWAEVEYYHWLHEEYCTGWVLKHYLERVPANYSKTSSKGARY